VLRSRHLGETEMSEWTKVVTSPLGLAGFALFLVFGYLAKVKNKDERRWVSPAAVLVSLIALVGGLFLAYRQTPGVASPAQTSGKAAIAPQAPKKVQQISTGDGSPNVDGVNGNVTITVDQSRGKTEGEKEKAQPAANPPAQK
jgi:hypothetical protein